jgi:hypothetical protein
VTTPEFLSPSLRPRKNRCPRCQGTTTISYDECFCLTCGWVEYDEKVPPPDSSKFTRGSKYRYKGEGQVYTGAIIKVIPLYRESGIEDMYVPACPLACGKPMQKLEKANLKVSFRCGDRHTITVVLDGPETGWR